MLVNVDPANPQNAPDPQEVRAAGFGGVRLVSRPGCDEYVDICHRLDLFVLAVVTEQSQGYILGNADLLQIGNEPDLAGTGDSMTPYQYREYWRMYRETYPNLPMISAGLGSGQTGYWRDVVRGGQLTGCSGMAIHPYNKSAEQARGLIRAYKAYSQGLPVVVSEWHRPASEVPAFAAMLRQEATLSAFFCWDWSTFSLLPEHRRAMRAVA